MTIVAKKKGLAGLRLYVIFMLTVCLAGLCAVACADGGNRPATTAEKDYYARVMNTAARALPAGPPGWSLVEKTKIEELKWVSPSVDQGYYLGADYHIAWKDAAREKEAQDAAARKLGDNSQKPNPEQDKLLKALERISAELGKAVERGDEAGVRQLSEELDKVSQRMEAINNARAQQEDEISIQNRPHDTTLAIDVWVNTHISLPATAAAADPPVAGAWALRTEGEFFREQGWQEGCTYVFLGSFWEDGVSQYIGQTPDLKLGLPPTRIQSVVVIVRADPARVQTVLRQIDWTALKSLLAN
ncbi:hypothetical protein [Anaeroselena agilis]|uniref:Uncharacterized protein n=1 Tax=Anaeroselena agilis TaxID=3063788 RepID=A0ABU3P3G7_9FIRM|nr:hypothetical protein [Selenomonadales bacterium 4137-cl]